MKRLRSTCRLLALAALVLVPAWAVADTWAPPQTEVTLSANSRFRATVIPRPLSGSLEYFEDKVKGAKPAGQRTGEVQSSPIARVEQLETRGKWRLLWQMPLVNDVGPPSVLLANDASFLVTFDNWHSNGYGDDVVVIYDRQGKLVRKLSLEQILPLAYVNHLPRSVSSRWWAGEHTLVDGDGQVELQVVEPGERLGGESTFVPVRIRLKDGVVIPPSGRAWKRAMAKATKLESQRLEAWEELRQRRATPLVSPSSRTTREWRHYMFELRDRIAREDESMSGMVLAAPGEDPGFHDGEDISGWIEGYVDYERFDRSIIVVSPTSDRLAALLVKSLLSRAEGSIKNLHLIFVGTVAEGRQVRAAAKHLGAKINVVDRTAPFPPGEPLQQAPPQMWLPLPALF